MGVTAGNIGVPEGEASTSYVRGSIVASREKYMGEITCFEPGFIGRVRDPYSPEEKDYQQGQKDKIKGIPP